MSKHRKNARKRNPITAGGVATLAVLGAAAFVAYLLYSNRDKLKAMFDPTAATNIFYRLTNKVTQTVTGDPNASLGTKIADVYKSDAEKAVDAMLSTSPLTGYPKFIPAHGMQPDLIIDSPGARPRVWTGAPISRNPYGS